MSRHLSNPLPEACSRPLPSPSTASMRTSPRLSFPDYPIAVLNDKANSPRLCRPIVSSFPSPPSLSLSRSSLISRLASVRVAGNRRAAKKPPRRLRRRSSAPGVICQNVTDHLSRGKCSMNDFAGYVTEIRGLLAIYLERVLSRVWKLKLPDRWIEEEARARDPRLRE